MRLVNGQIIQDYSGSSTYTWTPTAAGSYSIVAIAEDLDGSAPTKEISSQTLTYQIEAPITLTVNPAASSPVNAKVTLTANASGLTNPRYCFRVGQKDHWGRWTWTDLSQYTASNIVTWWPNLAGIYTVVIWVRESTSPQAYDSVQSLLYTVTAQSRTQLPGMSLPVVNKTISAPVSTTLIPTNQTNQTVAPNLPETQKSLMDLYPGLTVQQTMPVALDAPIRFTATSTGRNHALYRFMLGDLILRDYAPESNFTWETNMVGTFQASVWVKDSTDGLEQEFSSVPVTVTVTPGLTMPVLSLPLPPISCTLNSPVTLNASVYGGANVVYAFLVDGKVKREFSPLSTFVWTPANVGTKKLAVAVKDLNGREPGKEMISQDINYLEF